MEIHDKIRVMREINQWSQEEMAEKLSMSTNGYAKIERGQSTISIDRLKQIAQIFNINVVELVSNQGDKSFFFSIGDNNNHNYVGSDEKLILENEKLNLLLEAKEEIINQKNNEIDALKEIIALLKA